MASYHRLTRRLGWGNDPYWFIPSPDPVRWGMSAWFAFVLTGYLLRLIDRPPSMVHAGTAGWIAIWGMDLGCLGIAVTSLFQLPWKRADSLGRRVSALGWEAVATLFTFGGAMFSAIAIYVTSPDNGKYAAGTSVFVALMYVARGIQIATFLYQLQLYAALIAELQKVGDSPSPHN